MLLAHNHVANLFISSYRGATIIRFVSHQGTSQLGVVMSLLFDHMTLINLYISSYREATGATFIHANTYIVMDFLSQIFCDNKIQQILQERQIKTYFRHILHAIPTHNALFEFLLVFSYSKKLNSQVVLGGFILNLSKYGF